MSTKNISSTCPGEKAVIVEVGDTFDGCISSPPNPPPEDVLARVNATNLVAYLLNGGKMHIFGVVVVEIDGDSFTLNINADVPIDTIEDLLKTQIAAFLGGDYTKDDIDIEYPAKRAQGTVIVRVRGNTSDVHTVTYSLYLLLSLLLAALLV